jgi:anti-sigma regulatory factor (Ser/Thr protein kinase)
MQTTGIALDLELPAEARSVRVAREEVGRAAERFGVDDRALDDVRLCVSEAVTNVVRHAYRGAERGEVAIHVDRVDGELEVVVRDSGVGMTERARDPVGGFGLSIMRELSQSCTVSPASGGGTEVRMLFPVAESASRARR